MAPSVKEPLPIIDRLNEDLSKQHMVNIQLLFTWEFIVGWKFKHHYVIPVIPCID